MLPILKNNLSDENNEKDEKKKKKEDTRSAKSELRERKKEEKIDNLTEEVVYWSEKEDDYDTDLDGQGMQTIIIC